MTEKKKTAPEVRQPKTPLPTSGEDKKEIKQSEQDAKQFEADLEDVIEKSQKQRHKATKELEAGLEREIEKSQNRRKEGGE